MKILFYFFSALFALIGILAGLRSFELFASGGGMKPTQILIAISMLALAAVFVVKARTK